MSEFGRWWVISFLAATAIFVPPSLHAQQKNDDPLRDCATLTGGSGTEANRRCNLLVQTLEIIQGPLGLAMSGGNPVQGTASTLGMRLGSTPRISLGGRLTLVGVDLPQILHQGRRDEIGFTLPGLSLDAAVGILPGSSPLPTVGGVASVDLLASIGILPLPTGAGFESGAPFSWALGLRGGIFRESFTLPGISLSAVYRHLGRSTFGDPQLRETDSFFDLNVSALSFRGVIGKRLAGLGVTAGAGYDLYSSSGQFGFTNLEAGGPSESRLSFTRFKNNRASLFGNLSYTFLILHLVGEIGWQQGAGLISAPLPAGAEVSTGGHLFGGFAARLSI
jgi:hypothetical protein